MLITIDRWQFEIDLAATMEYSASEAKDHCTCAYCRNFYASVDTIYPDLRPFLTQFGLDVEAPDELIPYFPPTDCDAYYGVCGKIVKRGNTPISINGLTIHPQNPEEAMVNTGLKHPYFFLMVSLMQLPWVLEEPMEEAESPANQPSFINRVWDRLLCRPEEDNILS